MYGYDFTVFPHQRRCEVIGYNIIRLLFLLPHIHISYGEDAGVRFEDLVLVLPPFPNPFLHKKRGGKGIWRVDIY